MILVTLGTQDKSFKRLLEKIESLIVEGFIKEDVIVQAGYTKYKSEFMKIFDYIDIDEFNNLIEKSNIVITHGGVGTIMNSLKKDKKIIGCARLKKYNEHQNDHQTQILEEFDKQGYLIYAKNIEDLDKYIKKIENFSFKKISSNTGEIIKLITNFIDT